MASASIAITERAKPGACRSPRSASRRSRRSVSMMGQPTPEAWATPAASSQSEHQGPRGLGLGSVRQQRLGDRLELHVRRAFVDLADLGVAIQLLDGVVLRV